MNSKLSIYHFARPMRTHFIPFVEKVFYFDATICFDFEDSVNNLNVDNKNIALKDKQRQLVIDLINSLPERYIHSRIGVRVNIANSFDFEKDLSALTALRKTQNIDCIFLPKVDSSTQIETALERLRDLRIKFEALIPIIETVNGMRNLAEIFQKVKNNVTKIAFGHCDFNYDSHMFPFHHQDSENYWEWVENILNVIEPWNVTFINSPYLFLNDHHNFSTMLNRLHSVCHHDLGQITLCLEQTKMCAMFLKRSKQQHELKFKTKKIENLNEFAQSIIKRYMKFRLQSKNFALGSEDRILISPQEFLSAKAFLENCKEEDVSSG